MLTFSNPKLKLASSSELGPAAVAARVVVGVQSVQVHCAHGDHRWTARPGDGFTMSELGGLHVDCPLGHGSASYRPTEP